MPADVLTSKLHIPPLRPNVVARPRLVARIRDGMEAGRKLTLISAPAGFGKTTLVSAWLKQSGLAAAWLSLDEADNDLSRFLSYLAAACQQVDEEIGTTLQSAAQSQQIAAAEKGLAALLNEIGARTEPLILVLDDYHLLYEASILVVVEGLIRHQPPQLHLVLTTREDPDLPLARLRARDQLTEIRAGDLRFTQAECEAFLGDVMGLELSRQEVAALEDRTEGWAAGLQLAGLSMQRQADLKAFIADFSGSHRHILDYLTDEVLQQQPENVRTFLLQTAILDRLSGPLCDAVTGQPGGDRMLAHLEAANLFVIPLDEERRWFRYHHLFSDLLRNQLTRWQPGSIPELHRRASGWYEASGDVMYAVDHAFQASDLARAARLIEENVLAKLYQGHVTLALSWYDRLPEAMVESAPMLCIGKAWALALMQRGARRDEVDLALKAAERSLDGVQAGAELRNRIAGHAASIQAFLLQTPALAGEKPERLIALSEQAQRLLPEDEKAIRSVNALNIGYGYLALADLEAARRAFRETLDDGLAGGNLYAAIYGPINLALIDLLEGRAREALHLCDTNIERFNRMLAGQIFPPIGGLYIVKGSLLLEQDCLAEAEKALVEGLDLIRWTGEYESHMQGYTELARLRAIQGDRAAMLAAVAAMEEGWPEGAAYAGTLRIYLSIRHWPDDPQVQQEAGEWLAQSGILNGAEVVAGVDPMSAAAFASSLRRLHVLARLAGAAPGAYSLDGARTYLTQQLAFAEGRGITAWVVAIALARCLLEQAGGNKPAALAALAAALEAAAPTGLLRIFVDECDRVQPLLEALRHRLADPAVAVYAERVLEAMRCLPEAPETVPEPAALLSERELEVLRGLAGGLSYEEIGRQLYLSLNTVQFHVKHIYRKLLVNKRVQAIEKAREMKLI